MPRKFEHVLMCRLSKRQRFLYDDFMARAKLVSSSSPFISPGTSRYSRGSHGACRVRGGRY